jgi:hypothetical protein
MLYLVLSLLLNGECDILFVFILGVQRGWGSTILKNSAPSLSYKIRSKFDSLELEFFLWLLFTDVLC